MSIGRRGNLRGDSMSQRNRQHGTGLVQTKFSVDLRIVLFRAGRQLKSHRYSLKLRGGTPPGGRPVCFRFQSEILCKGRTELQNTSKKGGC